jgi:PTS system mannose-specific IIC component
MPVWWHLVAAALWGGVLTLERRAFLQAMASRPIVAGTVMGLLLGDGLTGLSVGVVFELLHLGTAALGAATPEHDTLPAVAAAALAPGLAHHQGGAATPAMWAVAILCTAPLGRLGRVLESALDRRARRYLGRAQKAVLEGNIPFAVRQNLKAMWLPFTAFAALSALGAGAGLVLGESWPLVPPHLLTALSFAFPALGVLAAGLAVQGSHARDQLLWGGFGATAMLIAVEGLALFGRSR